MRHNRKRIAIGCFIWFVVLVATFLYQNLFTRDTATYTASSDSVEFTDQLYVSDNSHGFGVIYKMSPEGAVDSVYVTHRRNYVSDWKVLKLANTSIDGQLGGNLFAIMQGQANSEGYVPYRIVSFTQDLITDSMSAKFYVHTGATVTGFSFDEESLYITCLSDTRQDIYLYKYDQYNLISFSGISTQDRETLAGTATELSEISVEHNAGGLLYVEAEYMDGTMYSRVDNQDADDYFSEDLAVKEVFDNRSESFFDRLKSTGVSFFDYLGYLIFGSIIIATLVVILSHRRRATYRIFFTELFIVGGCLLLLTLSGVENQRVAVREYIRNEVYALMLLGDNAPADFGTAEFFSSTEYATYHDNMLRIASRPDAMAEVLDVAVVEPAGDRIIMSVRGYSGGSVSYVYGDGATSLLSSRETVGSTTGMMYGEEAQFICVQLSGNPQYSVLCVSRVLNPIEYVMTFDRTLPILALVLIIIGSFLAINLILYETRSLNLIIRALEKLGSGDGEIEIPDEFFGYDIKRMWASINEISKNLRRISRQKLLTYEAYYRFAPKKIETILGKDDITEVKIGHTKRLNGTVAIIMARSAGIVDEHSIESRNRFFELTEKYSESNGGIFVSTESDLSAERVLFLEDNTNSIVFGTDLSREAASDSVVVKPTILLHYASYLYGVAGTNDMALTFLSADDLAGLEKYALWLGKLGVSMVITEPVRERESGVWDVRFIGFINPDPNHKRRRINLYEVLDATDGESRRGKKKTIGDFGKALNLFYEKDFYFARNAFTDILREVPSDEIAKWYLFECERLLNEQASPDFAGELHFDE